MKKVIILTGITIMLSGCFGQDIKNQENPIRVFSTGTIEEMCSGKTTENESKKSHTNVQLLNTSLTVNTSEEKKHKTIIKSDLNTDKASIKAMTLYKECIDNFLSPGKDNSPNMLENMSAYDVNEMDKMYVTIEGEPEAKPDESWFFGIHYNDWTIKYAATATNRSSYPVSCSYKISSCPFTKKNTCISLYDLHIKKFKLESGDIKNIDGEFDFNYNNDKKPPIETKLNCAPQI